MQSNVLRTRVIQAGEWFFQQRSWTPVLFMLFLALYSVGESADLVTWMPGLVLLVAGEGWRLWGGAIIGKESRTRGSGVARLVTNGPYRYVRNPLYLGNFLLTLAATCLSELLWFIPIIVLLFLIQYVPIVLWEEQVLTARFGEEYAAYCRRVPRWIPRWSRWPSGEATPTYRWRAAFWSERSTLATLTALVLCMLAKENFRHIPKYLRKHHLLTSVVGQPSL